MACTARISRVTRLSPFKTQQLSNNNVQRPQRLAAYHSYNHPSPSPFSPAAESILTRALKHVPAHGFTQQSLHLGAQDAGYMSVSTNLFPRGAFDLIIFYLMTRRLALHDLVAGQKGLAEVWTESKTGVGLKVRTLLLHRLRMNQEAGVVSKWSEVSVFNRQ